MMRFVLSFVGLVLLGSVAGPATGQPAPGRTFEAKIMEVLEGDTYTVQRKSGTFTSVRLWGVDTPELGQPFGALARIRARRYALGRWVRVHVHTVAPDGTVVARLEGDNTAPARNLLRDGLAWRTPSEEPTADDLQSIEKEAQEAKRGLWKTRAPVPPWKWREGLRAVRTASMQIDSDAKASVTNAVGPKPSSDARQPDSDQVVAHERAAPFDGWLTTVKGILSTIGERISSLYDE